ncbi:putative folate metabolism gamma-glutamate ligase [Candidatus Beckwithbacteria bacterium]|nr:putative folate metabolism gamma-glutamate ligase [Candidatus Beckwithbacteria bacterium]
MRVKAIKTKLVKPGDDLLQIIEQSIAQIPEQSVLAVTSKIISYAQNQLVPIAATKKKDKIAWVKKEAELYYGPYSSYKLMLAIKNNTLCVNAGIDSSNAQNQLVLWPKNLQQETNRIWQFLRDHYHVKQVGVIVTDSKTTPLRWGVTGTCLAHCGFKALRECRGDKDLFGYTLTMVQVNVAEALAVAATFEMGEVAEQTPLAIINSPSQVEWQDRVPSKKELDELLISLDEDVYAPMLTAIPWQKGDKLG